MFMLFIWKLFKWFTFFKHYFRLVCVCVCVLTKAKWTAASSLAEDSNLSHARLFPFSSFECVNNSFWNFFSLKQWFQSIYVIIALSRWIIVCRGIDGIVHLVCLVENRRCYHNGHSFYWVAWLFSSILSKYWKYAD